MKIHSFSHFFFYPPHDFKMALQLLDLMHTLHTRAASIYSSWAEEQRHLEAAGKKIEADSETLWSSCWCPLLQGKVHLCGSINGK